MRYGVFYGNPVDPVGTAVPARQWPIAGGGGGVWSFIHLEDAAAATVLALEHDGPAIYNIVDDEPATTAVWLTELAKVLDADPPQPVPPQQARAFAGERSAFSMPTGLPKHPTSTRWTLGGHRT
ncbi:MAG TPA: hypothetical protein VLA87_07615 [Gaiellaceae bacterium]|nr:hypothetical protein [Gaiellaceae bacterium]